MPESLKRAISAGEAITDWCQRGACEGWLERDAGTSLNSENCRLTVSYCFIDEFGWGGRIRTYEWRDQNPLPYHLATPQPKKINPRYCPVL